MRLLLVVLDFIWCSVLATVVARGGTVFLGRWLPQAERGSVLVGLGVRLGPRAALSNPRPSAYEPEPVRPSATTR
jgi:hypothetical protein